MASIGANPSVLRMPGAGQPDIQALMARMGLSQGGPPPDQSTGQVPPDARGYSPPPTGQPDLTGTQGNTPGGVQGAILWLISKMLGPNGQLAPGAGNPFMPSAQSLQGPPTPDAPITPRGPPLDALPLQPPPRVGGWAMGAPKNAAAMIGAANRVGGGLPPPAAMPGDVASGASLVRPGMSARAFQDLLDPQKSLDRTMARPTGASLGAPGITPPPPPPPSPPTALPMPPPGGIGRGAQGPGSYIGLTRRQLPPGAGGPAMGSPDNAMMSQVIRDMVAKGGGPSPGDGVPVTPGIVDPRLAPGGRPSKVTPPAPRYGTRKVAAGDTLSGIARSNDPNKLRLIQAANPQIRDINRIAAGDTLNIPGQVVGVDHGSQNHPAMAGKKGQAPSGAAKLKSGFLAAAQGSPSQKARGVQRVSGTRRY